MWRQMQVKPLKVGRMTKGKNLLEPQEQGIEWIHKALHMDKLIHVRISFLSIEIKHKTGGTDFYHNFVKARKIQSSWEPPSDRTQH